MFLLVRTSEDYLKYALISVLATGGAYVINFIYSRKYFQIGLVRKVNWKKHMKPMLLLFFNTLAVTIYVNSDITILGFLKGDYYVGIYSTAVKIYTVLKQVVNALIVASLPRLSFYVAADKKTEYHALLNRILKALILALMPLIVGVIMVSRDIVVLVSGKAFVESSTSLKLLSVAIGFSLLASFFTTTVLLPHKKDATILKATIVSACLNFGLNFVLIPKFAEKGAALTTVLAELVVMCIALYYSREYYRISGMRKTVLEGIAGMVGIVIICTLANQMISGMVLRLAVAVGGSMLYYFIVLILCREELLLEVLKAVAHRVKGKK
jgi:O-antigen/teichoic acid export membrane protein